MATFLNINIYHALQRRACAQMTNKCVRLKKSPKLCRYLIATQQTKTKGLNKIKTA